MPTTKNDLLQACDGPSGYRLLLYRIVGVLVLLALSPLIIGLAPIWVPLNWYQNRQWRKDMARPRGCLTYQITQEQSDYLMAQVAREREQEAKVAGKNAR